MKFIQQNQKRIKTPIAAYMGYLFQSFFKRPFGYIVGSLYLIYLAVIFLIVPSALHFSPLTIWNIAGFNIPIINLFFIAGSAASIAVVIFRTSRDDGMDLNLSAKPLTKGITVMVKTCTYLIIMLVMCLLSVVIVSLIKPVFGKYDLITNITGIEMSKYRGLMLSIFVGNLVNMLLFGGIAVFICMVGGQVATIVGSIGIVILMCILSFIFPQVLKNAASIISEDYGTDIRCYSASTLRQYNHPEEKSEAKRYAEIDCFAPQGEEKYHFDTYEYWTKATKKSGRQQANYIDFARQLSDVFNGFGMSDERVQEAGKMIIGLNSSYNYYINKDSHVTLLSNIEQENYPIIFYYLTEEQGIYIPKVRIMAGDMNLEADNWYLRSSLSQYDFNASILLSERSGNIPFLSPEIANEYNGRTSFRLNDLHLFGKKDWETKEWAKQAYLETIEARFHEDPAKHHNGLMPYECIREKFGNQLYDQLNPEQRFEVVSKTIMYWVVDALERQKASIESYYEAHPDPEIGVPQFPYNSKTIVKWIKKIKAREWPEVEDWEEFDWSEYCWVDDVLLGELMEEGCIVDNASSGTRQSYSTYAIINNHSLSFVETYNNLYTYTVENFFNVHKIIAGWSVVAGILFAGSIIVYKRTDFK